MQTCMVSVKNPRGFGEKITSHRSSYALQEYVRSHSVQKATSNALASPLIQLNKKWETLNRTKKTNGYLFNVQVKTIRICKAAVWKTMLIK